MLLREYRISVIPIKKYSRQNDKRLSPPCPEGTKKRDQQQSPRNLAVDTNNQQQSQHSVQSQKQAPHNVKNKNSPSQKPHHHHHHHKHGAGTAHHHHHHHHKKHKNLATTYELKPEELNRMLELASGLSFLKLVTPTKLKSNGNSEYNQNGNNNENETQNNGLKTYTESNTQTNDSLNTQEKTEIHIQNIEIAPENAQSVLNRISRYCVDLSRNCNNRENICNPYIFEKVDYIKRFKETIMRRKELRKLKRTKNKQKLISSAHAVVPETT